MAAFFYFSSYPLHYTVSGIFIKHLLHCTAILDFDNLHTAKRLLHQFIYYIIKLCL